MKLVTTFCCFLAATSPILASDDILDFLDLGNTELCENCEVETGVESSTGAGWLVWREIDPNLSFDDQRPRLDILVDGDLAFAYPETPVRRGVVPDVTGTAIVGFRPGETTPSFANEGASEWIPLEQISGSVLSTNGDGARIGASEFPSVGWILEDFQDYRQTGSFIHCLSVDGTLEGHLNAGNMELLENGLQLVSIPTDSLYDVECGFDNNGWAYMIVLNNSTPIFPAFEATVYHENFGSTTLDLFQPYKAEDLGRELIRPTKIGLGLGSVMEDGISKFYTWSRIFDTSAPGELDLPLNTRAVYWDPIDDSLCAAHEPARLINQVQCYEIVRQSEDSIAETPSSETEVETPSEDQMVEVSASSSGGGGMTLEICLLALLISVRNFKGKSQ